MAFLSLFATAPQPVRRSAGLMYLSLLLGAATQLGERLLWGTALPAAELARLLAFLVLAYGLSGWVVWELVRGRQWARLALSAWFLLSAFAWWRQLALPEMTIWQHAADALVLLLDATALVLVWFGEGKRWFHGQPDASPVEHDKD